MLPEYEEEWLRRRQIKTQCSGILHGIAVLIPVGRGGGRRDLRFTNGRKWKARPMAMCTMSF
jgi:hypothetical protein